MCVLQGSFPPLLVNKFVNDVPLTVDAVRKVVLAKAAAVQKVVNRRMTDAMSEAVLCTPVIDMDFRVYPCLALRIRAGLGPYSCGTLCEKIFHCTVHAKHLLC